MSTLPSRINVYRRNIVRQLRLSSGVRGAIGVLRAHLRAKVPGLGSDPVAIPMKKLGGRELLVRPGTSDLLNASYYYADDLHLPAPVGADSQYRQVCELGSNMGACLSALASRFPEARIVGVEPDGGNAGIATRNLSQFGDRCTIVQAGIWDSDTDLVIDRSSSYGEHGFTVREKTDADGVANSLPAFTIDTILEKNFEPGDIDYMHVTIEGTERRVFAAGGRWVDRVLALRVEAHPEFGYPAEECRAQLEALGYDTTLDNQHPTKWVHAVKRTEAPPQAS